MRCTQNPTMGEEWRRGWHPEHIPAKSTEDRFLVVGAGPAGLEAAMQLGKRGYDVVLADARAELGGRVALECRLPGLASWGRVRDHRAWQIGQMGNVAVYGESRLDASQVLEMGCSMVAVATGASWRRDGVGRGQYAPVPGHDGGNVFTPDDVMAGVPIRGPVVVYDTDHYYMGGVVAEALRARGLDVALATPAAIASAWTEINLEQSRIQSRLIALGVEIVPLKRLEAIDGSGVELACIYGGPSRYMRMVSVVLVTTLVPEDELYRELRAREAEWPVAGVRRVTRTGDCYGPNTIAQAVWSGHCYARTLGEAEDARDEVPFRRELVELSADF